MKPMNKKLLKGRIREMAESDLDRVLQWRNQTNVRQFMYTQHEITPEEHRNWFENALRDNNRHLLVYEEGEQSLGVVNFNQKELFPVADWGFYLAADAPAGTGQQLCLSGLDYAFNEIRLHKICGEALAFNERSIQLHLKLGFNHEGTLREQFLDKNDYHDILCFGLLDREWNLNVRG